MPVSGPRLFVAMATLAVFGLVSGLHSTAFAQGSSAGRMLAPSILNVIPPGSEPEDTVEGPVNLPFVSTNQDVAWDPKTLPKSDTLLERGKNVIFRSDAYCLEFSFKNVRMIDVEVPTKIGFRTKRVWYLLYRVRYLGSDVRPVPEADKFNNKVFETTRVSAKWVRFIPQFRLIAKTHSTPVVDRVVFPAKAAIAARERVGGKIYDSVDIQQLKIPLSTPSSDNPVWGVATWIDINPNTDFFSIEVRGLTNAQKLVQKGDNYTIVPKSLELFFTRPGDSIDELSDRIRFGIPAIDEPARQKYVLEQFGAEERLDYRWVYR